MAVDVRRERARILAVLPQGSVFTVPRGTFHKPSAPAGARLLLFEPTGTLTVGDRHEEIPAHVGATTGYGLP